MHNLAASEPNIKTQHRNGAVAAGMTRSPTATADVPPAVSRSRSIAEQALARISPGPLSASRTADAPKPRGALLWFNTAISETKRIIADQVACTGDAAVLLRSLLALYVMREIASEADPQRSAMRARVMVTDLAPALIEAEGIAWVDHHLSEFRRMTPCALRSVIGCRGAKPSLADLGQSLGRRLGLDAETRSRLNVRMIVAVGITPAKRATAKRACDRSRAEARRRASGIAPRAKPETVRAMMAETGRSRATCYRRLRRADETFETENRATRTVGSIWLDGFRVSRSIPAEVPSPEAPPCAARHETRHPVGVPEGPSAITLSADGGSRPRADGLHSAPTAPPPADGGRMVDSSDPLRPGAAASISPRTPPAPPADEDDAASDADAFEDAPGYEDEPDDDEADEYAKRITSPPMAAPVDAREAVRGFLIETYGHALAARIASPWPYLTPPFHRSRTPMSATATPTAEVSKPAKRRPNAYARYSHRRATTGLAELCEAGRPGRPGRPIHELDAESRDEVASRWLERLRLPDTAASLVLDDTTRRYVIAGLCVADHAHVSDVLPEPAAYRRCLRLLEATGLVVISRGTVVPQIGATVSQAQFRATALALNRPAQPRAKR